MDIRNVQKTGNMYYVYLPTKWVKLHGISGQSKVSVLQNVDGSITICTEKREKSLKPLNLKLSAEDSEVLHKVIVACYINPTKSFKIELDKKLDFTKILDQKKLVSIELVELEDDHISCESMISLSDPAAMLITMVRKVKNLLSSIMLNYDEELVNRYEEEIDRNKTLIEKAVITSFALMDTGRLKMVDLHYISRIANVLERMVDHLISLPRDKKKFLEQLSTTVNDLHTIIKDINVGNSVKLDYPLVVEFLKTVSKLENIKVKDVATYDMRRIVRSLSDISEVLIDWAITKKIEEE